MLGKQPYLNAGNLFEEHENRDDCRLTIRLTADTIPPSDTQHGDAKMTEQTIELISQAVERIKANIDPTIEITCYDSVDGRFSIKRSGKIVRTSLKGDFVLQALAKICAEEFTNK
jgi:hypothetical protein